MGGSRIPPNSGGRGGGATIGSPTYSFPNYTEHNMESIYFGPWGKGRGESKVR